MKILVSLMAAGLFVAFMVAVYGVVDSEPDLIVTAGMLAGLAVSPMVLGYGYKLLNYATKGLAAKPKEDNEDFGPVTSIPMSLPYDGETSRPVSTTPRQIVGAARRKEPADLPLPVLADEVWEDHQVAPLIASTSTTAVAHPAKASGETTNCPFCGEAILKIAKKCKHCGEYLDPLLRAATTQSHAPQVQVIREVQQYPQSQSTISGGVAALCSFFWPGLGQIVSGRVGGGVLWMIFVLIGYGFFILPGLILHLICIIDAANVPRA